MNEGNYIIVKDLNDSLKTLCSKCNFMRRCVVRNIKGLDFCSLCWKALIKYLSYSYYRDHERGRTKQEMIDEFSTDKVNVLQPTYHIILGAKKD